MRCLNVAGDTSSVTAFASAFAEVMENKPIALLKRVEDSFQLMLPGSASPMDFIFSFPPALILVSGEDGLIAPTVYCGEGGEEDPLRIGRFLDSGELILEPDTPELPTSERFTKLFDQTIHLLPQRTAQQCGRCGSDCAGLAASIIRGESEPFDCFYHPRSGVLVTIDGMPMSLAGFPAQALEGSIRGFLSTLKGFREGGRISLVLPER